MEHPRQPINFIENRFHYLSPFSAHQIEIWGETFSTVEHAYQARRIKPGDARKEIKNAKSPMDAWRAAQKYKDDPKYRVEDHDKYETMVELCKAKMEQHPDIVDILKESRGRGLLKVYPTDYYWGTGADGSGKNILGHIWMELRDELSG